MPQLIAPEVRARLKDLSLSARYVVHAPGFGLHASRSRGTGLEFSQYRAYEPGDEPRQIDWKLYARSDRFFVREAEADSPLELLVLLDLSQSMAQADASWPEWSRLAAARSIAACALELAFRQGDRFALAGLGGPDGLRLVPAANGVRQRDRCLAELHALRASGTSLDEDRLRPLWERAPPGTVVLLLSDGFDEVLITLACRLAAARRDVLSVQILTVGERDFPYQGGYLFRDPETGTELRSDGAAARDGFLQRFAAARAALAARLAASGVRACEYFLDQPVDAPLRQFFLPRARHTPERR